MPTPFTHLHLHSEYSLLDGLCRVDQLIERAHALGMDSMGITDHGVLHAIVDFYRQARTAGIKPIIGMEAYLASGSRRDRLSEAKKPYHLTLLAKDQTGYRNLLNLATKAQLEGFYYKPRIDRELLEQHGQGVIAFSGCLNGEIPRYLLDGRDDDARNAAVWFKERMGGFYFEMQRHGNMPELDQVNAKLIELGRTLDIPMVATNDVHYVHPHEHDTQDVLLAIQTNTTVDQEDRLKMADASFFLKDGDEMTELFHDLPEAIETTRSIADACDVSIDFSTAHLPRYPVPGGGDAFEYLSTLCRKGLTRRYANVTDELERRLAYELQVIRDTNFPDYFLVVWDIIRFASENGILYGVRGSAAASLVLYTLGVTNVDPMRYRLVFERFLNIERKEMPDIDMDFQDDRRDEVIDYVVGRYGSDRVAQIITFGTLGAKAALRDTGRVLGMSYGEVDGIARLIPPGYRKGDRGEIMSWTIDLALEHVDDFRRRYEEDERVKNLVDTSRNLEGVSRSYGTHAAGVVIADEPLIDYVPLARPKDTNESGIAVTQFAMDDIASLGLLKMDFLGLVNLQIIQRAITYIAETRGEEIDLHNLSLEDQTTFDLLASGETTGVFQLESTGMRRYIKELKPSSLGDLSAMIALYRPGPIEQIPNFIESKRGKRAVRYPHPILQDVLEETYGIIVYQDQVLLILQQFAGYTLGQADIVRKAMGKKIAALMQEERDSFIAGARAQGYEDPLANQVWELIEPFAGYAFNKAHSVSYALIAYWTAYFKANYPAEYMAALLTCFKDSTDKVTATIAECRRLEIDVLPPDIGQPTTGFSIQRDEAGRPAIRYGLAAVKNVGESAVAPLVEEQREHGPFEDIADFCRRAPARSLNRRTFEALIKVGALDRFGGRGALLDNLDRIISIANEQARIRDEGQSTMFDLFGDEVAIPIPTIELEGEEIGKRQCAEWEREGLGVALSEDPLLDVYRALGSAIVTPSRQVDAEMEGDTITIAGRVSSVRMMTTRRDNRPFVIALVEDFQGSLEVAVWPNVYERTAHLWEMDEMVVASGKVRVRDDRPSMSCDTAEGFEAARARYAGRPRDEEPPAAPAAPVAPAPADPAPADETPFDVVRAAEDVARAVEASPEPEGAPPVPETSPQAEIEQEEPPPPEPQPVVLDGEAVVTPAPQDAPPPSAAEPPPPSAEEQQPAAAEPPPAPPPPLPAIVRTLYVTLEESNDESADLDRFNALLEALKSHGGESPVRLTVTSKGQRSEFEVPLTVGCDDLLMERLRALVGERAVRLT